MKITLRFKIIVGIAAICLLLFNTNPASAGNRWIDGSAGNNLDEIIRDPIRNKIYVLDNGTAELVVINTETEKITKRIPIAAGGNVTDIALSKDNQWMGIASGEYATFVNLNNGNTHEYSHPDLAYIVSIAFDYNGDVFIVGMEPGYGNRSLIYHLEWPTGNVMNQFGVASDLSSKVYKGLMRTDNTGTMLYVGERGLSPLSITKIDVSTPTPVFVAEDNHGELGSNLKDIVISPRYDEIYVASGAPYGIQVVDSNTISFIALLDTGAYPGGVDINVPGDAIYGIPHSPYNNNMYKFDAQSRELIETYELLDEWYYTSPADRGIAVGRFGFKTFIVSEDYAMSEMKIQVVDSLTSCY